MLDLSYCIFRFQELLSSFFMYQDTLQKFLVVNLNGVKDKVHFAIGELCAVKGLLTEL